MKIGTKLLYAFVKEHYPVTRFGRVFQSDDLPLPIFYNCATQALQDGALYLVRTQDLPRMCRTSCLFLCAGNRPAPVESGWQGEVWHLAEPGLDVFTLFNFVIGSFDKISRWDSAMRRLLEENAPVEEFVRCSLPVFENCITITDYDLRILVSCEVVEGPGGQPSVRISDRFDRIPEEVSKTFHTSYKQRINMREPYTYKGQREDPEGDNYCINLFQGSSYLGTCTLWNQLRPMRESDFILFGTFSDFICTRLSAQSGAAPSPLVTLKTIFSDLLQCFPVSRENLQKAMELQGKNMELQGIRFGCWHCLAIRSANRNKTLPEGYLCTALENALPNSTAMGYEDMLVLYCMVPEGESLEKRLQDTLLPYLRDMNFRAGISTPFRDIFKAREYFLQAQAILRTGWTLSQEQYVYRFEDYILPYMLQNATGGFDRELVIAPGLRRLRELENTVDYWDTLRRYLDNECNASKTAQELFLHRSSLLPRLEKIRSLVNLDTPEQRLYLRMCISLLDMVEEENRSGS